MLYEILEGLTPETKLYMFIAQREALQQIYFSDFSLMEFSSAIPSFANSSRGDAPSDTMTKQYLCASRRDASRPAKYNRGV